VTACAARHALGTHGVDLHDYHAGVHGMRTGKVRVPGAPTRLSDSRNAWSVARQNLEINHPTIGSVDWSPEISLPSALKD
jgi:hypothetical protein